MLSKNQKRKRKQKQKHLRQIPFNPSKPKNNLTAFKRKAQNPPNRLSLPQ